MTVTGLAAPQRPPLQQSEEGQAEACAAAWRVYRVAWVNGKPEERSGALLAMPMLASHRCHPRVVVTRNVDRPEAVELCVGWWRWLTTWLIRVSR